MENRRQDDEGYAKYALERIQAELASVGKDVAVLNSRVADFNAVTALCNENSVAIKVLSSRIQATVNTSWVWIVVIGQIISTGLAIYLAVKK